MNKSMIKIGEENSINEKLAREISYEEMMEYGKQTKKTFFHFEELPDFPFPGLSPTLYPIWEEDKGEGYLVLYADYHFSPQSALYLSVNTDYLMEEMEKVVEHSNKDIGHQLFEIAYAPEEDYDYMISTGIFINPDEMTSLYDCLEFINITYMYPLFVSSLRFAALKHQEEISELIKDMDEIIFGEDDW